MSVELTIDSLHDAMNKMMRSAPRPSHIWIQGQWLELPSSFKVPSLASIFPALNRAVRPVATHPAGSAVLDHIKE